MRRSPIICLIALTGAISAGGCATVPRDAGFGDVQKAVAERTGVQVHWNRGTDADKAVESQVQSLLQRELTAETAVQIALLNSPALQATYEDLGVSQAELVQAGLLSNPVFEFDPRWPTKSGFRFNYQATLVVDFIDLLFRPLRQKVAESQFEAAKQRVAAEVVAKAAETKAAFYRLQAAEQLVEMRRVVARAAEVSADAARRLREAGNVTPLNLLNEQGLHEKAKVELADAEADALDQREELNMLMGLWGNASASWRVSSRLPDLPATEIELDGLESLAIRQRMDLKAAATSVQAQARSLNLTGYTRFPFSTGVHAESESDHNGPTNIGPHFETVIPLFDQGQAKVAGAEALLRQGIQRYTSLAVQIRAEVRRAHNRVVAQRSKAEYYRRVVIPLRQRATAQTQLEYNAMQIGVFQLLQAKQEEINAGREFIEAMRDYWVARSDLEKAAGGMVDREKSEAPATQPASPSDKTTSPTASPAQPQEHQH